MNIRRTASPALFTVLVAAGALACGGEAVDAAGNQIAVLVDPPATQVLPGSAVSFAAAVTGTANTAVSWIVLQAGGGTVDATGYYVAPQTLGTYNVVATSVADPGVSSTAAVTVTTTPSTGGTCANTPPRSTGTIYYYCNCGTGAASGCVAGNDANTGTTPSAPRQTLANAASRFNSMGQGSTVALCRGGSWAGSATIGNANCRGTDASTYCDFRDYVPSWGSAATPRPIVTGTTSAITLGTGQGYRVWNLDMRISGAPSSGAMLALYGNYSYIDLCNVKMNGAGSSGQYVGVDMSPTDSTPRYITIRQSEFRNFPHFAMGGGFSNLVVDSNLFVDNGYTGSPQDHHVYLASNGSNVHHDIQFTNNDLANDSRCNGVMLVIHTHLRNLTVSNNRFMSTSTSGNCAAIYSSGSAGSAGFDNLVVTRNRTTGSTAYMEISCCRNCTVSDNILSGANIGVGTDDGGSAGCDNGGTTGAIVENNSLYGGPINITSGGTGHVLASNAVWRSSGSCYSAGGNTTQTANYCRTTGGVAVGSMWADAPNGNFTPVNPGPLIGSGSSTYYSPTAIGSVTWNPTDTGRARTLPVDVGAYAR